MQRRSTSTDAQFLNYISTTWLPQASAAQAKSIDTFYPNDITAGSPFDTGILDALSPQFKRIAAFQGDGVFQAPRRFFQQSRSGKQKQWGFCKSPGSNYVNSTSHAFYASAVSKRLKATPFLGSVRYYAFLRRVYPYPENSSTLRTS
jgi:hypothetical protein